MPTSAKRIEIRSEIDTYKSSAVIAEPADQLNRVGWGSSKTVDEFTRRSGFVSPGEARVMQRLASEVRDQPILDIGVGGGRTTLFLSGITRDYLGIDYLGELVAAARSRFPEVRFEQMDARDLSGLGSGSFAAVVFSFNGIDGMSHRDRARAFAEIHRVLRPGGWFAYSTLNLAHPLPPRRPNPLRMARDPRHFAWAAREGVLGWWDRLRMRAATESGEGWATVLRRLYGHPMLWHRVSTAESVRELRRAQFHAEIEIYTWEGEVVVAAAAGERPEPPPHPESADLHVLARRS